tara:strand:+ start:264 stop:395 length:132 start_codon:yes stop_codon:yes gene_type:complete
MVRRDEMNPTTISKYEITISKYGNAQGIRSLQGFSFKMNPAND